MLAALIATVTALALQSLTAAGFVRAVPQALCPTHWWMCGMCPFGGDFVSRISRGCAVCSGLCGGGNAALDACLVCGGMNASMDACGVCFGDNSTCLGCDGVPNSGVVADVCGDCGGSGTSCLGCDSVPIPLGGKNYDACTYHYSALANGGGELGIVALAIGRLWFQMVCLCL